MVWPYALVAVTAVPAYFFLTRWFSYWGAAAVTVYSELLIAGLSAYQSKKITGWQWPWLTGFKVILASLAMIIVIWPLRAWASQGAGQLLLVITMAGLIYVASLLILKVLNWRQWRVLISSDIKPKEL